jgi:hypothetical protein
MADYSYIGSGKIYMRDLSGSGGLLEIGNVSKLDIGTEEETKELRDYRSPGGGVINEVRRITGVTLAMTLHDLNATNLAMSLYGTTEAVEAGSATSEVVTAKHDALVRLAHTGISNVVVQDETDTTTYTAGTDYEVRPGGIFILSTGSIADGATLHVDYDYGAQDVVQALDGAQGTYELVFEGLNEARSGKPVIVDVWRARFGAAKTISLIGDDYAGLEVEGKALKDTSKPAGTSQYFRVTLVE